MSALPPKADMRGPWSCGSIRSSSPRTCYALTPESVCSDERRCLLPKPMSTRRSERPSPPLQQIRSCHSNGCLNVRQTASRKKPIIVTNMLRWCTQPPYKIGVGSRPREPWPQSRFPIPRRPTEVGAVIATDYLTGSYVRSRHGPGGVRNASVGFAALANPPWSSLGGQAAL